MHHTIFFTSCVLSLWTVVNLTGQKISAHLLSTTVQKQPVTFLFFDGLSIDLTFFVLKFVLTHPFRLDSSLTGATWGSSISTGFCQESLKPKTSHW